MSLQEFQSYCKHVPVGKADYQVLSTLSRLLISPRATLCCDKGDWLRLELFQSSVRQPRSGNFIFLNKSEMNSKLDSLSLFSRSNGKKVTTLAQGKNGILLYNLESGFK